MEFCSSSNSKILTANVSTPLGQYLVKACNKGVHHVSLEGITDENFHVHHLPPVETSADMISVSKKDGNYVLDEAVTWLSAYFSSPSKLAGIDIPPPPFCFPQDRSTAFERKVWTKLAENVKFGETMSYGQLGKVAVDNPKASRAVGTAVKKNPIAIIVPCHRVIKSNGEIGNYVGGKCNKVKEWLIHHELNNQSC